MVRRRAPLFLLAALVLFSGLGIGLALSEAPRSRASAPHLTETPPNTTAPTAVPSTTTPTTTTISPSVAACAASDLAVAGGRQGDAFRTASGLVVVQNTGTAPCALIQVPILGLLDQHGAELSVQDEAPTTALVPVVLAPGAEGALTLSWANWCARNPGFLQVQISFPGGAGGSDLGEFNQPSVVPGCLDAGRPSTLQVVGGYSSYSGPITPAAPFVAATGRCQPGQLTLSEATQQPSPETEQNPLLLVLTNVSSTPCSLDGYPGISLSDAHGDPLPLDYRWGGDQEVTSDPPERVGLAPGGAAYVLLNKNSCEVGPLGQVAQTLRLIPPDDTAPITVVLSVGHLDACSGADPSAQVLAISPVEPSEAAAFSF